MTTTPIPSGDDLRAVEAIADALTAYYTDHGMDPAGLRLHGAAGAALDALRREQAPAGRRGPRYVLWGRPAERAAWCTANRVSLHRIVGLLHDSEPLRGLAGDVEVVRLPSHVDSRDPADIEHYLAVLRYCCEAGGGSFLDRGSPETTGVAP